MIRLNIAKSFPISTRDNETIEYLSYYRYADAFGWTPEQVDKMDVVLLEGLGTILDAKSEAEKEMMKNARR